MPDYSKCIIYKLCCKNLDVKDIYVGSTCNFVRRKSGHKTDSKNLNSKVYKFIRDNGGFQNWDMIMVEEYPCENKMQKVKRERYWCEELKSELNSDVPGRDWKESVKVYREKNKDAIKEQTKQYREDNKEKVKESQKEWREKNKDAIKQSQNEWREKNKDAIKQYQKEWREANKEKLKEKNKQYRAKKKNELLT